MGVEVNKAGADDQAGGVDDAGGVAAEVGVIAPVDGQHVAGDGHGGAEAGAAGAVNYLAVGNQQVNHKSGAPLGGG